MVQKPANKNTVSGGYIRLTTVNESKKHYNTFIEKPRENETKKKGRCRNLIKCYCQSTLEKQMSLEIK